MQKFNMIYSRDGSDKAHGFTSWGDFKERRDTEPYYAPIGWRRWAIDLGLNGQQFQHKYGDWPVLYHGTKMAVIHLILANGFRLSKGLCYISKKEGAVYLSPSIVYSGHPRYAEPYKKGNKWVQVELQITKFIYNDC